MSDTPDQPLGGAAARNELFARLGIGPGAVIGNWVLARRVGTGTFGVVYQAEQSRPVQRTVAIKLLHPSMRSEQILRWCRSEFQSLALLSHPNIASLYDVGQAQRGVSYIVMEFVPGVSLTCYCRARDLDLRTRLRLFCHVCEAVHHAHDRGVIHGDLKPSNILVVPPPAGSPTNTAPTPKIVDFGLTAPPRHTEDSFLDLPARPREMGEILGTLAYMAPELADGQPDQRVDIYSLGVIAYELLTGRLPFDVRTGDILVVLSTILSQEPPPLVSINRALRGVIQTIVSKAMASESSRRYCSAADLCGDVGRYRGEANEETPA